MMAWFRKSKEEEPEGRSGLMARLKQGLKKTSDLLRTDIRDLAKKDGQLVDEWLDPLFAILIKTDMGAGPAGEIRDAVQEEFRGRVVQREDLFIGIHSYYALDHTAQNSFLFVALARNGLQALLQLPGHVVHGLC